MKNIALKVEKRNEKEIKRNAASKLGRMGYIPAVMYGLAKKPESIKVERKELVRLLKGHSISSVIFDLHIDDKSKDKDAVIIKEYQRDPITNELITFDWFMCLGISKATNTAN